MPNALFLFILGTLSLDSLGVEGGKVKTLVRTQEVVYGVRTQEVVLLSFPKSQKPQIVRNSSIIISFLNEQFLVHSHFF